MPWKRKRARRSNANATTAAFGGARGRRGHAAWPFDRRSYLSEAISKLGAQNRVDAARLARLKGWL
jgi:hypothetical protein